MGALNLGRREVREVRERSVGRSGPAMEERGHASNGPSSPNMCFRVSTCYLDNSFTYPLILLVLVTLLPPWYRLDPTHGDVWVLVSASFLFLLWCFLLPLAGSTGAHPSVIRVFSIYGGPGGPEPSWHNRHKAPSFHAVPYSQQGPRALFLSWTESSPSLSRPCRDEGLKRSLLIMF